VFFVLTEQRLEETVWGEGDQVSLVAVVVAASSIISHTGCLR